jgi:hypothetical protein
VYALAPFYGELRSHGKTLTSELSRYALLHVSVAGELDQAELLPAELRAVHAVRVFAQDIYVVAELANGRNELLRLSAAGHLLSQTPLDLYPPLAVRVAGPNELLAVSSPNGSSRRLSFLQAGVPRWALPLARDVEPVPPALSSDGRVAFVGPIDAMGSAGLEARVQIVRQADGVLDHSLTTPNWAGLHALHFDRAGRLWVLGQARGQLFAARDAATVSLSPPELDLSQRAFAVGFDRDARRVAWVYAEGGPSSQALEPTATADGSLAFLYRAADVPGVSRSVLRSSFAAPISVAQGSHLVELNVERSSLRVRDLREEPLHLIATRQGGLILQTVQRQTQPGTTAHSRRCRVGQLTLPSAASE